MENLIYWNNTAIGIDCGNYISWFANAPREAIEYYSKVDTKDI
jgi:hypothetical protein